MDRNDRPLWEALLHAGHTHLPTSGMSRRQMLGVAGAAGAILVTGLPGKAALAAKPGSGVPKPQLHATPGPFGPLHFYFPGPVEGVDPNTGHDPSTISDFNGFIGNADLLLSGTGTNLTNPATAPYTFHADMRFMKGVFTDTEGQTQKGSFAFI